MKKICRYIEYIPVKNISLILSDNIICKSGYSIQKITTSEASFEETTEIDDGCAVFEQEVVLKTRNDMSRFLSIYNNPHLILKLYFDDNTQKILGSVIPYNPVLIDSCKNVYGDYEIVMSRQSDKSLFL